MNKQLKLSSQLSLAAFFILISVLVICLYNKYKDKPYYEDKAYINTFEFNKRRISQIRHPMKIFLGDSLVQAWCVTCYFSNALNLGVGHQAMPELSQFLKENKSLLVEADNIIVLIGHNDFKYYQLDRIQGNVSNLKSLFEGAAKITWIGIPPVGINKAKSARTNMEIKWINEFVKKSCLSMEHCNYLSPDFLKNTEGYLRDDLHSGDGVHLNNHGYDLLAKELTKIENKNGRF